LGGFLEWKKAPADLVEFITQRMKDVECDYRKMFGYPAYFINGNMFVGVFGDKIFLRLSDADITEALGAHMGVGPFEPMKGRPMRGYVFSAKNCLLSPRRLRWIAEQIHKICLLVAFEKEKSAQTRQKRFCIGF
jgi:TfoX/Sxy family transcriptional regulator of competence genes